MPENPLAHPEEATPFGVQTELNGTSGTGNGGLPYERQRKELALAEFEQDKAEARRKLRTASWAMMFFLVSGRMLLSDREAHLCADHH